MMKFRYTVKIIEGFPEHEEYGRMIEYRAKEYIKYCCDKMALHFKDGYIAFGMCVREYNIDDLEPHKMWLNHDSFSDEFSSAIDYCPFCGEFIMGFEVEKNEMP